DVVGINGCVDDPENRFIRELPDGSENFRRQLLIRGIDEHNSFVADLHGHVVACANQHMDIALNRQGLNFDPIEVRRLPCEKQQCECDEVWNHTSLIALDERAEYCNRFPVMSGRSSSAYIPPVPYSRAVLRDIRDTASPPRPASLRRAGRTSLQIREDSDL